MRSSCATISRPRVSSSPPRISAAVSLARSTTLRRPARCASSASPRRSTARCSSASANSLPLPPRSIPGPWNCSNTENSNNEQENSRSGGRRLRGHAPAADRDSEFGFRHRSRGNGAGPLRRSRKNKIAQPRRAHARRRNAAHGWSRVSPQSHAAAPHAGGHVLVAHARWCNRRARCAELGRHRFRRQTGGRRGARNQGCGSGDHLQGQDGGARPGAAVGRPPRFECRGPPWRQRGAAETQRTHAFLNYRSDHRDRSINRRNGSHQGRSLPPAFAHSGNRSEEHTSELQSLAYLVCRLLLEKKKKKKLTLLIRKKKNTQEIN